MAVWVNGGYNRPDMELVLQSVNYHDCPIGQREKVSLANGQQQEMLRALLDKDGIVEAAILQTCNRTEIYLYAKKDTDWLKPVRELMGQLGNEAGQTWQRY